MRIPESHVDIVKERARAVLSTVNDLGVFSAFCFIKNEDEKVLLDIIDVDQIEHIRDNERVSIMAIDPSNVDRWFCIQGTIDTKEIEPTNFNVKINKIILFPKAE